MIQMAWNENGKIMNELPLQFRRQSQSSGVEKESQDMNTTQERGLFQHVVISLFLSFLLCFTIKGSLIVALVEPLGQLSHM